MEKTATWIWPERYSDFKSITVTEDDITYLKSLIVAWDVAELGAPAFMDRDGELMYDLFEESDNYRTECLLSLFVSIARLNKGRYTINNPLLEVDAEVREEALYGLVDKPTKTLLEQEQTVHFEFDDTLEQVLATCDLNENGFDPKRGFGLRNLQEIIDPEKTLSKSQMTKARKQYKGRLFLYLQALIEHSKIDTGVYHTHDGFHWKAGDNFAIAEHYTRHEWSLSINSDYFNEICEYIGIIATLPKLTKHLNARSKQSYADIVNIFNIDHLFKYDSDNKRRLDISLEEILLRAIEHFPEDRRITTEQDHFPFILLLIRIYNAQGRFNEAAQLLKEHNLYLYTEDQLEFFCTGPNTYQQIAFYESCICEMVASQDYSLWYNRKYPKFTDQEIATYDLYTGGFFLDDPEDKKKYDAEQLKISKVLDARPTLVVDIRNYMEYQYRDDIYKIYDDLDAQNKRADLDEIMVSILGQLFLMEDLDPKS